MRVRGKTVIVFLHKIATPSPVVSGLSKRETIWKPGKDREEEEEDQVPWKHNTSGI